MKSFTSFFTEARVSQASQQAERRGLTGDGHGNWMDKEGNIVAKTEQGRLVLLDKKVKAPQGYHWMKAGSGYKLMKNPRGGYKAHKGSSLMASFKVQMVHSNAKKKGK